MGSVIHMDTEQARAVARQLDQVSADIQQEIASVGNRLRSLNWQSPNRDKFVGDFTELQRKFQACSEQGAALGLRVQREVEEWVAVDQTGAQNFANVVTTVGIYAVPIGMLFQDALWRWQYGDFKDWWAKLNQEDKVTYLRSQYQKIARQNGLDPVEFKVEDLPDSPGSDARGVYRGNDIAIDVDNIKLDEPWRLTETIAHETRHQFQEHAIETYNTTGQVPEGCTEEQVKAWSENMGNYHDGKDDFEAYWTQPLEDDAREQGSVYMKEVLENKDWGSIPIPDPVDNSTYASNSTSANTPGAVS